MKFKHILTLLLVCLSCLTVAAQESFNLGFETISQKDSFPEGWIHWGIPEYETFVDSVYAVQGNFSGTVKAPPKGESFGALAYKIPNGYKGSQIRLEGYIKTSEVKSGFAGLMMRLDKGDNHIVEVDNMQQRGITGTKDWEKYEITLPLANEVETIYVAGILQGEGQAWFDDFRISIDNRDIASLPFKEKKQEKAKQDHEFDKGSKFSLESLNKQIIDNLYKLCIAWGELKYTNTEIAKGTYNWDYELFRILPIVQHKEFEKELGEWKKSYGENENTTPQPNYYIDFVERVGNPIFKNENAYTQMVFPDDGYRLLALFRYWNMIAYFYPYKDLIQKDWHQTLKEYIPEILKSDDELSYKLAILKLVGEIRDTHAYLFDRNAVLNHYFGERIVPLKIKFIENKAIVTQLSSGLSENTNLRIGDEIISINGERATDYIQHNKEYFPSSNYSAQLRDMAAAILRTNKKESTLRFIHDDEQIEESFPTFLLSKVVLEEQEEKLRMPSHKNMGEDIGYIYPGSLQKEEVYDIMMGFMDKKGIIVDLRTYPSDNIVFTLGQFLMPKPIPFVKFKIGNQQSLGTFQFTEPLEIGYDIDDYYKGKVAILVNEETQSNAEYTVMALQVAPRARVFGSQTAGADGNISKINLPGGLETIISGIGMYYPDGTETQQTGTQIDEEIKPTIEGIRQGRDEVLNKAIEYIRK